MTRARLFAVLASLVLAAPLSAQTGRGETDHLIVEWVEGTPPEVIEAAKAEGERYYSALAEMLNYEPAWRVTILLQGRAERPDGSRGFPRVDSYGRIHLYQFESTIESYFSALAHEMVHVFRFRRQPNPDWFFEEGFAEFIALRVDSSLDGFPWYGFSPIVAAGQWLARGEDIPLATLRERHREINQRCKAQSYTLRSDFFHYLGRTHGNAAVLAMATEDEAGDLTQYQEHFGASFATLAERWRKDLIARFERFEGSEEQGRLFRESPIQYAPVCRRGQEF